MVQGLGYEKSVHRLDVCSSHLCNKWIRWIHDERSPGPGRVEEVSVLILQFCENHINYRKEFHNPDAATRGLLNAIMSVGSIVALPVTPYIADVLGRRVCVITGCIIMVIGMVLQSVGVNI
jgi:hypothetical protein